MLLSRPRDYVRVSDRDRKFAKRIEKKYPAAAAEFVKRAEKYNKELELAKEYEKKGKVLILSPDDCLGVETLTRDKERLKLLYEKGRTDAAKVKAFLLQKEE